jgi:hypothetical protein
MPQYGGMPHGSMQEAPCIMPHAETACSPSTEKSAIPPLSSSHDARAAVRPLLGTATGVLSGMQCLCKLHVASKCHAVQSPLGTHRRTLFAARLTPPLYFSNSTAAATIPVAIATLRLARFLLRSKLGISARQLRGAQHVLVPFVKCQYRKACSVPI